MPSCDGGDDFIGVGYPSEGFGVGFVIVEEAVDGRLKVDDRPETLRLRRRLVRMAKKPSTALSPGGFRREMEDPARMARQPIADDGMFVGCAIVENDMDDLAGP